MDYDDWKLDNGEDIAEHDAEREERRIAREEADTERSEREYEDRP